MIDLDSEKRYSSGVDIIIDGLRDLGADRSSEDVMRLITTAAAASLAESADAALTVLSGGERLTTRAATGELPIKVDALQYEHGGPSVDALRGEDTVVHAADLSTESRWPAFTAALAGLRVGSMLSYRLYLNRADVIGALNVYPRTPLAFTEDAIHAGERLAAYAAVMLAHANEHDKRCNLERALDSNRDIGAAIGIMMSRYRLSREQAFDLLRVASQQGHRKLRDLAEEVVAVGELPAALITAVIRRSKRSGAV